MFVTKDAASMIDKSIWTRRQAIIAGAKKLAFVSGSLSLLTSGHADDKPASLNDRLNGALKPVHDPCIIQAHDSVFHLFTTSHMVGGRGLIHWRTSPDLVTWAFKGAVMQAFPDWVLAAVPETKGIWAPDISWFNEKYHLYFAASTFGSNISVIGLMTTPTLNTSDPAFGWKDEGLVISSTRWDDFNAIDPNHIIDADGRHWLAFGSFWSGIKLVELDPKTGKLADDKDVPLSLASRYRPGAVEAPFIIRKGDYYYLFASYDFCCRGVDSSYYTACGRSSKITGPYLDRGGSKMLNNGGFTVLHADLDPTKRFKGPGGASILKLGEREIIVYHAYDAQNKGMRTLRMQNLEWTSDGWPVAA
jgi:arabinan endo-1,5-alpha-L-arabinosidase